MTAIATERGRATGSVRDLRAVLEGYVAGQVSLTELRGYLTDVNSRIDRAGPGASVLHADARRCLAAVGDGPAAAAQARAVLRIVLATTAPE